ncbi:MULTISPECIES: L-aspartate oxidase [unclassified Mesorhizobium]|uniref:L-aspartate oxidase n=1 Tax=unclassified Mesorhizobium TaxID=325217 RepID=UPI002415674D|nr:MULTISPECIES: L-aspartate oxidase [unclassified Mesorhizobium]MDG4889903.1 L-aspartate oxidase [Mesorhizobium sp. WSM4887]MDG4904046.1 L-aspartate oxidase [Mesorhizobium sp. WSM4962]MDG4909073.1 L-aspartate oxidase [Mesorhizobium sp. WSM4898]MDG4921697.1 L-aspartate oxidase [Mesorhizobium sp. WSM4989]
MTQHIRDIGGAPVIVGAGIAGLMCALHLAPQPVVLLSRTPLGSEASSALAQGGLAASVGGDDSPELHLADTLAAGDGLCDEAMARRVVEGTYRAIGNLVHLGVAFDRTSDGALRLGLEAAHSRRRIVHAAGDATGRELVRALATVARRTPSITILEGMDARRLLVENGAIAGVLAVANAGAVIFPTRRVVLATGGIGALFRDTTNPTGSFGHGLALAACAGAELADLEFVQFHPTALDISRRPMPLISEAVRGEGAVLVNEHGQRFLADTPGGELASRDVVTRAIWQQLAKGSRVFLDARHCLGPTLPKRFPSITRLCQEVGIDPAVEPIPVRPAVHYHMGGVAVDAEGRSSVSGLWACGEVACTGFHGANRLASNSLTEAVATALWVAETVAAAPAGWQWPMLVTTVPPPPDPSSIRQVVSESLGVIRHGELLAETVSALLPIAAGNSAASDPALVALMIAVAALRREESRGAHYRSDFPTRNADTRSSRLTLATATKFAATLSPRLAERSAS